MTILSKSESVETRGIEETMEYIQTALKQGFQTVTIERVMHMNAYKITINTTKR